MEGRRESGRNRESDNRRQIRHGQYVWGGIRKRGDTGGWPAEVKEVTSSTWDE